MPQGMILFDILQLYENRGILIYDSTVGVSPEVITEYTPDDLRAENIIFGIPPPGSRPILSVGYDIIDTSEDTPQQTRERIRHRSLILEQGNNAENQENSPSGGEFGERHVYPGSRFNTFNRPVSEELCRGNTEIL